MSKRSYVESMSQGGPQPPEHIDSSHMLPINDLLSPDQEQQSASSSKKPRNFIATVVSSLLFPLSPREFLLFVCPGEYH